MQAARTIPDASFNKGERLVVSYRSLREPTLEEAQAFPRRVLERARARGETLP
jgi:hypothetical protein